MNNATSATLNALKIADTYVVTAHDLFKMVPYVVTGIRTILPMTTPPPKGQEEPVNL